MVCTLSARVNEEMPFYVAGAVMRAIASQPVALEDAKVLILGVAFKRDVDDTRHSPALRIYEILRDGGVKSGPSTYGSMISSASTRAMSVAICLAEYMRNWTVSARRNCRRGV